MMKKLSFKFKPIKEENEEEKEGNFNEKIFTKEPIKLIKIKRKYSRRSSDSKIYPLQVRKKNNSLFLFTKIL